MIEIGRFIREGWKGGNIFFSLHVLQHFDFKGTITPLALTNKVRYLGFQIGLYLDESNDNTQPAWTPSVKIICEQGYA